MTITSTEERSTRLEQPEGGRPETVVQPPAVGPDPPPTTPAGRPAWRWSAADEDAATPAERPDWLTRFAAAKTLGGW